MGLIAAGSLPAFLTPQTCRVLAHDILHVQRIGQQAVSFFCWRIAGVRSPALTGWIVQHGGGYSTAFALTAGLASCGAIAQLAMVRERPRSLSFDGDGSGVRPHVAVDAVPPEEMNARYPNDGWPGAVPMRHARGRVLMRRLCGVHQTRWPGVAGPPHRYRYFTGVRIGAPLFLIMNTMNFAGFVLLAFRPTVCTS